MRALLAVALLVCAGCECEPSPVPGLDGGTGGGGGGAAAGGTGGGGGDFDAGCLGPEPCYGGPPGTAGTGACRMGARQCFGGALGPCVGQVLPMPEACDGVDEDCNGVTDDVGQHTCGLGECAATADACVDGQPTYCEVAAPGAEACDGKDNDCDGITDEGCDCVYVSAALGADNATGDQGHPFKTISEGIAAAKLGTQHNVCIGVGGPCPRLSSPYPEAVEMAAGISLQGGYDETSGWAHSGDCYATVQAVDPRGLHFGLSAGDAGIEGLIVQGFADGGAAITIDGAKGVTIAESVVTGGGGDMSIGVLMVAGAEAVITQSTVTGGTGRVAIGVQSEKSKPLIIDNCDNPQLGRCVGGCANNERVIRASVGSTSAQAIGVLLEDSPGAVIDTSTICAGRASDAAAAVWIHGAATGTVVRASTIEAIDFAPKRVAVSIEHCGGSSPWIFANPQIIAGDMTAGFAEAVRVAGDCPARIDSNDTILAVGTGDAGLIGVHCTTDETQASSRCVVTQNGVFGLPAIMPRFAVGVQCDPGSCALVQGNRIDPGDATFVAGVVVTRSGPLIARNDIFGECAPGGAVGLLSQDSFARVENNLIQGAYCPYSVDSVGVQVLLAASRNELDLNSNTIGAVSTPGTCTSVGVAFALWDAGVPNGPRGMVRNNIIAGGRCDTGVAVAEGAPGAEPRFLENNDLLAGGSGVYLDEGSMLYTSIYPVNVLIGSAANISADPRFDGGIHLSSSSPCRNAGTSAGAPLIDCDQEPRPQEGRNDIGADEYRP